MQALDNTRYKKVIQKKWIIISQKNGAIIDRKQIANEFNAFFRYVGPKLASKIPNPLRPFEFFIKN